MMNEYPTFNKLTKVLLNIFVPSFVRFLYIQRVSGFNVPTEPHFDRSSTPYFLAKLETSKFYLEYGSGGSTFLAAQKNTRFMVVDSDSFFLKAVKNKIEASGLYDSSLQKYIYADIGLTGEWGCPVFTFKTSKRLAKWACYPNCPWGEISTGLSPDLILVDGRFRVACALTTIKNLCHTTGWVLLVDDYLMRHYYQEIERFAILEKMLGSMAVFTHKPNIDMLELDKALSSYIADSR
jgi:hypothetical protein